MITKRRGVLEVTEPATLTIPDDEPGQVKEGTLGQVILISHYLADHQ